MKRRYKLTAKNATTTTTKKNHKGDKYCVIDKSNTNSAFLAFLHLQNRIKGLHVAHFFLEFVTGKCRRQRKTAPTRNTSPQSREH